MLFSPDTENRLFQLWNALVQNPRAAELDNLDSPISSRLSLTDAQVAFAALSQLVQTRATPKKIIVLDTPGAGNFIVPDDVYSLNLSMCGAGSGCVYVYGGPSNTAIGNGGSGASIVNVDIKVFPGQVIPYVIGTGGNSVRVTTQTSEYTHSGIGGNTSFLDFTCRGGGRASGLYVSSQNTTAIGGACGLLFIVASDVISGSVGAADNCLVVDNVHYFHGVTGLTANSNSSNQLIAATPLFAFNCAGMGGFVTVSSGSSTSYAMNNGRNGAIVIKMETAS
ncbi:MAG: hypothetical protein LBI35_06495 [Burkholderiales bacterium]|jgi:hypothetical protein|nr:hypothetical protein [Burkholderiales bacterium]